MMYIIHTTRSIYSIYIPRVIYCKILIKTVYLAKVIPIKCINLNNFYPITCFKKDIFYVFTYYYKMCFIYNADCVYMEHCELCECWTSWTWACLVRWWNDDKIKWCFSLHRKTLSEILLHCCVWSHWLPRVHCSWSGWWRAVFILWQQHKESCAKDRVDQTEWRSRLLGQRDSAPDWQPPDLQKQHTVPKGMVQPISR